MWGEKNSPRDPHNSLACDDGLWRLDGSLRLPKSITLLLFAILKSALIILAPQINQAHRLHPTLLQFNLNCLELDIHQI